MAHYDIFREQLAIKYPASGHALWEPIPGIGYERVQIGEVGFIREGQFHRLFNALLPEDHPSLREFGVHHTMSCWSPACPITSTGAILAATTFVRQESPWTVRTLYPQPGCRTATSAHS
jgi:hypothetical protein